MGKKDENGKVAWVKTVATDFISFFVPGISSGTKGLTALVNKWDSTPKTFNGAEELYSEGLRMIENAKEEIISLSTFKNNPSLIPSKSQIEYKLALYKAFFIPNNVDLNIVRYLDYSDWEKCTEAQTLKLLTNSNKFTIKNTKAPVELLMIDNKEVLIGFPGDGNDLYSGFLLKSDEVCSNMKSWLETVGIEEGADDNFECTMDECLCSCNKWEDVITRHTNTNVHDCSFYSSKSIGVEFNKIAKIYNGLYDLETERLWKSGLARSISKKHLGNDIKVLDLGCGTAINAKCFSDEKLKYVGVDISEDMITEAKKDNKGFKNIVLKHVEITKFLYSALASNEKYDVIMLLGNSFDFILGKFHKQIVLALSDSLLNDGGHLIFSGANIPPKDTRELRKIDNKVFHYNLKGNGVYCLNKVTDSAKNSYGEFIMQPVNYDFVFNTLEQLGKYTKDSTFIEEPPNTIGPDYKIKIYKKEKDNVEE
jgi:SAM-dependent methyltransferase